MVQAVRFDAEKHIYTNENNIRYTSATQLIGHYKQPFLEQYWSLYKAAQRVVQESKKSATWSQASRIIMQADKTETRLRQFLLAAYPAFFNKILHTQVVILQEWQETKDQACTKGTLFHNAREYEAYQLGYSILGNNELQGITQPKDRYTYDLAKLPDGYWPELLVFDHLEQTAGQIDRCWISTELVKPSTLNLVKQDGIYVWDTTDGPAIRYVDLDDWKTNKEIKKTNRYDKMQAPVAHLHDTNYWHYALQISIYGRMLERCGYTIRSTRFTHCLDDGTRIPYHTPYLRKEVTKLISDYRQKHGYNHSPESAPNPH
ncbi:hypothetical protein GCM10028806_34470 [Spirosoma terrae]|uniref:PD-(D/E)XK endonuclease-like domain-containing protein n=1 Tax=Spirosoma terrae TaxID=1968276 RepID=A0A6L9L9F5_9BACT|nr:hypothetical protein [Spirosoma terrae]NDU95761.1 hypothetical protein [Spirosoma terrae]